MKNLRKKSNPSEAFIDSAIDFIRTYADQTHHGKEEDILFRELKKKQQLSAGHKKIMNELLHEQELVVKIKPEIVCVFSQPFPSSRS